MSFRKKEKKSKNWKSLIKVFLNLMPAMPKKTCILKPSNFKIKFIQEKRHLTLITPYKYKKKETRKEKNRHFTPKIQPNFIETNRLILIYIYFLHVHFYIYILGICLIKEFLKTIFKKYKILHKLTLKD